MKIGDVVVLRNDNSYGNRQGRVIGFYSHPEPAWVVEFGGPYCKSVILERDLQIVGHTWVDPEPQPKKSVDIKNNNNKKNMSTIKNKFTLMFKSEPEKTFRKAGITNGDDFLTEDGQNIFLSWLLKKYGADFKTEVVDELVKETEDENE